MTIKGYLFFGAVAALCLAGFGAACAGFDGSDIVRAPVQPDIQHATGSPERDTLRRVIDVREQYAEGVQRTLAAQDRDIEDAARWAGVVEGLATSGLAAIENQAAAFAGSWLPALTALGGLLIRRPGDKPGKQATEDEKTAEDRGWDMAKAEGRSDIDRVVAAFREAAKAGPAKAQA